MGEIFNNRGISQILGTINISSGIRHHKFWARISRYNYKLIIKCFIIQEVKAHQQYHRQISIQIIDIARSLQHQMQS